MGQATMFLSTRQAADCFGCSPRTLERYRGTGEGAAFYRFGRHVRYRNGPGRLGQDAAADVDS